MLYILMHILDTITRHLWQKIKRNTKCSPYIYIYIYIFFFFQSSFRGCLDIFLLSPISPHSIFVTHYLLLLT